MVALVSVLALAACFTDPETASTPATSSTPPSGEFASVSAGYLHTCGVRTNGSVACWGFGEGARSTPPSGKFASVSSGRSHTCGVKTDDSVACWGGNEDGQAAPPKPESTDGRREDRGRG